MTGSTFTGNSVASGGGIFINEGPLPPILKDNTFTGNIGGDVVFG